MRTNLEDLRVSIAADRLISGIIVPGAAGLLNPFMNSRKKKKDALLVTEQERCPISADFESEIRNYSCVKRQLIIFFLSFSNSY